MDTLATDTPAANLFEDVRSDHVRADDRAAEQAPFADGKDPQALRTIGEVAKALMLRPHVLRYWEEQFPTLQPIKRSGNRRYYRPQDIALIAEIDRLVNREGYTLRGAAKAIEGQVIEPLAYKSQPAAQTEHDKDLLHRIAAIRDDLAEALRQA
ncbi:MerR family transcriptional regulator [Novosphingobium gossypii]|uniref:MerR family transcriptional regulator n=1 Tax=Novosphingobium gossypii TaxID=1604774 RepID=UPI003D244EDF